MSNLRDFLQPDEGEQTKEVIVSRRFIRRDEEGKPILDSSGKPIPAPFVIRRISQEENERLVRQSTRTRNVRGQAVREMDSLEYGRRVVVTATVTPDFTSEELCRTYGTLDPLELPGKMLLIGEYQKLTEAVMELSGLDLDLEDQAKN